MKYALLFGKITIYFLLLAGLVLLLFPLAWFPPFLDVRYMGWAALLEAALIHLIPRLMRVPTNSWRAADKNRAADLLYFLLAFAFFTNAIGDAGLYQLYKVGLHYDKILHFLSPLVSVWILAASLRLYFNQSRRWCNSVAFITIVAISIAWEVFEYVCDEVFGTRIYGVNGLNINFDTKTDLLLDLIGSIIGIWLSHRKSS